MNDLAEAGALSATEAERSASVDGRSVAFLAAIAGCVMVSVGFFLPWLTGEGVFELRSFSGMELATLLHERGLGLDDSVLVSAGPLLLYLSPASAAAALAGIVSGRVLGIPAALLRMLVLGSSVYTISCLTAVALLAALPIASVDPYLGRPDWGFGVVAAGPLLILYGSRLR
jgi:uncharacterized membrane protein (UPF0136 family)